MKSIFKLILYIITAFLDISLIGILFLTNSSLFDYIWISFVLISHALFYFALHHNKRYILDNLHYLVFIFPTLSIFSSNIYIKILSLALFVIIQILWIKEKKCILNEDDYSFGYGDELNYFVLIFSLYLAFNIGQLWNENSIALSSDALPSTWGSAPNPGLP